MEKEEPMEFAVGRMLTRTSFCDKWQAEVLLCYFQLRDCNDWLKYCYTYKLEQFDLRQRKMSFFGFPFTERFNYTCKVQTFLEAENISSYVSAFLAVLQLFTQLCCCIPRSQYSWMWRHCLCCSYSYRAKFLNGSALFLLHSPLVILRYGVYLSCSRDTEQSCNILHSCFGKALWTL